MKFEEILDLEERLSFDFFWKEVSLSDRGYGLIRDNTKDRNVASIASVGFGLSALPAGVERGWITRKSGEERRNHSLLIILRPPAVYPAILF